jgi:hypothetical protein
MKSNYLLCMIAGSIAGLCAGFFTGVILDQIYVTLEVYERASSDIYFVILSAIPSIAINGILGAFFGLFFALFFDRIPANRILKGLTIGLIYCLFAALYPIYGYWAFEQPFWSYIYLLTSPMDKFIYGIVFVFLYKPTK